MDEQMLAGALQAQEPAAARELIHLYGDRLLRSAVALCGNPGDAEDLVQETFLQALRSAPRFRGQSSLYTWLHGILLNLSRHYFRDRKRLICDDELAEREMDAPEEAPSQADAAAAAAALGSALGRLSAPHREVIVLRYYESMKIHEMARHLGISKGTVKSRLHYAIAQMQKMLPGELNLFGPTGTEEIVKQ